MLGLLVVTHGRLAEELVHAAKTILGPVEGLEAVRDGTAVRTPQKVSDGRQYYVMHPRLMVAAEERLRRYCRTLE